MFLDIWEIDVLASRPFKARCSKTADKCSLAGVLCVMSARGASSVFKHAMALAISGSDKGALSSTCSVAVDRKGWSPAPIQAKRTSCKAVWWVRAAAAKPTTA